VAVEFLVSKLGWGGLRRGRTWGGGLGGRQWGGGDLSVGGRDAFNVGATPEDKGKGLRRKQKKRHWVKQDHGGAFGQSTWTKKKTFAEGAAEAGRCRKRLDILKKRRIKMDTYN